MEQQKVVSHHLQQNRLYKNEIYLKGRNFRGNKFSLEQIFARINFRDFGQIREIREN